MLYKQLIIRFIFKKGCGYHLDLLIIALCIGINSALGIPWFVAATVLSMNHVLSLKLESQSAAPGEKPKFLGIIEQRVTGLCVFLLIGASVFLTRYLKVYFFYKVILLLFRKKNFLLKVYSYARTVCHIFIYGDKST